MSKSSLNDALHIVRNYDEVGVAFEAFGLSLKQLAEAADAYAKYIKETNYASIPTSDTADPLWSQSLSDTEETIIAIHPNGLLQARRKRWKDGNDRDRFENYCFALIETGDSAGET